MLRLRRLGALWKQLPFRYLPGLFAAVAVILLVALGALEGLEYWSLEKFFELRGSVQPTAPIVIVAIDESSFIELNQQWPFPRAAHAAARAGGRRARAGLRRPALPDGGQARVAGGAAAGHAQRPHQLQRPAA